MALLQCTIQGAKKLLVQTGGGGGGNGHSRSHSRKTNVDNVLVGKESGDNIIKTVADIT